MAAGKYNILIQQGATFNLSVIMKDGYGAVTDLSGYTARSQIREKVDSPTPLVTITCSIPTPQNGRILMTIPAATTTALNYKSAVYDLEIEKDGVIDRVLQGNAVLSKEVTR